MLYISVVKNEIYQTGHKSLLSFWWFAPLGFALFDIRYPVWRMMNNTLFSSFHLLSGLQIMTCSPQSFRRYPCEYPLLPQSIYIYMFRSQHSEESCWPDLFLVYFTSLVPGFLQGRKLIYILGHHIPSILSRITKENHDLVFYYFKVKKFAIKTLFCFKNMYK